jgi:integrase
MNTNDNNFAFDLNTIKKNHIFLLYLIDLEKGLIFNYQTYFKNILLKDILEFLEENLFDLVSEKANLYLTKNVQKTEWHTDLINLLSENNRIKILSEEKESNSHIFKIGEHFSNVIDSHLRESLLNYRILNEKSRFESFKKASKKELTVSLSETVVNELILKEIRSFQTYPTICFNVVEKSFEKSIVYKEEENKINKIKEEDNKVLNKLEEISHQNNVLLYLSLFLVLSEQAKQEEIKEAKLKKEKRRTARKKELRNYRSYKNFLTLLELSSTTYINPLIKARVTIAFILLYFTGLREANLLELKIKNLKDLLESNETIIPIIKRGPPQFLMNIGTTGRDFLFKHEDMLKTLILTQIKNKEGISLKDLKSKPVKELFNKIDLEAFLFSNPTDNFVALRRENFDRQLNRVLQMNTQFSFYICNRSIIM